jgi:hypothetical protein
MSWPPIVEGSTKATKPFFESIFAQAETEVHAERTRAEAAEAGIVRVFAGQSTGAGTEALAGFSTLPAVDLGVHTSNTAFGWHALKALTGLTGVFALTGTTAIGGETFTLTGVEGKAGSIWAGGTSNTPIISFRKLPAGVTTPQEGVAYYVVSGAAGSFKLASTHAGTAIIVAGASVTTEAEIALYTSTEDNTAIGSQAGLRITTGGGNTLVGENSGVNLTTGEENTVLGCEALGAQQTQSSTVAIGFRSLGSNTTGGGNTAVGTSALENTKTTGELTAVGFKAMQEATSAGKRSSALGYEALKKATGETNTALGALAGKAITTGESNTLAGALAGNGLTEGKANVVMGVFALGANATGNKNVAIGTTAGEKNTGSSNIFLGNEAGAGSVAESNMLYVANNATTPLIKGVMSATAATQELGFYGAVPVKRHATIANPAETTKANTEAITAIIAAIKGIGIIE